MENKAIEKNNKISAKPIAPKVNAQSVLCAPVHKVQRGVPSVPGIARNAKTQYRENRAHFPNGQIIRGPVKRPIQGFFMKNTAQMAYKRIKVIRKDDKNFKKKRGRIMSLSQLLDNIKKQREHKIALQNKFKPIILSKKFKLFLKESPKKILYNGRIIDYKHCCLLKKYIGLGGRILPRRQTRLTSKQQRNIAKTIKSARILGLLPFVSKEKGYF